MVLAKKGDKIMNTRLLFSVLVLLVLSACEKTVKPTEKTAVAPVGAVELNIEFEKFTLENGLDVVLHVDKSDPIVAINLAVHVGSSRETAGRTGFAHLFEHLLFLDSENLGYGGLDEMNTRIGGEGTNGFTTHDMTQYFQAVPADALEKVIWAEADKLGYFINTVSEDVVANEKQVVKNEKRQRVDNQPYGHNWYVVNKALYPEDHPYNWQVIGSLEDLDAARLADVKQFYSRWYVPNNVTVTISGDFDTAEAKKWVKKYFAEIPRGEDVSPIATRAGVLQSNKLLFHEDNFAKVPRLNMVWPAVEKYHPDSYALNILSSYLTNGKRAPLNEVLIDEMKLTSNVSMFNYTKEVSGEMYLTINANPDEDLDALSPAITKGFERFEKNGIREDDLNRIKAGLEVSFYGRIQSALGKAIQLGEYNVFTGDPGFIKKDIQSMQAVTREDVMRVYNRYIKDKHYLATSFVPQGQLELVVTGSVKAQVAEENIVKGAETTVDFDPKARAFVATPSAFDRTIEPEFGEAYTLPTPTVWREELSNGASVIGIENDEIPLVYFSLALDAGRERGDVSKPAVANLTADLLSKGTASKTTAELEDTIKALGSSISIYAGNNGTFIEGSTLSKNFDATMLLVTEMLIEPRWDQVELDILLRGKRNELEQGKGNPNVISSRESRKLRYPNDHMFHYLPYGTIEKLQNITIDDLKTFYRDYYKPSRAKLRIVGDVDSQAVVASLSALQKKWTGQSADSESLPQAKPVESSAVYFYDIPDSKQSVLELSRPSLNANHADLASAQAMNFLLGGIYTSKLNWELRVNKGYTYGIRSGFRPAIDRGIFSIRSSVRSNVTKESIALIRNIVDSYGKEFTEDDLTTMKSALLRGQALKNETLSDKLAMLSEISSYGYADDYKAQNAKEIDAMSLERFKNLAKTYLRPDAWNYLVVGDAATQAEGLKALELGTPIMLKEEK
jgi:zinc protease